MGLNPSYAPPVGTRPWSAETRPLCPILDLPQLDLKLPTLVRRSSFVEEWYTLSTHLLPAAFPRSTPDVAYPTGRDDITASDTKQERMRLALDLRDKYNEIRLKNWDGRLVGNSEKILWAGVNRYVHKEAKTKTGKKMTLFLAHATGFMKEVWEPMLRYLMSATKSGEVVFDEIWAWEAVNHGDSALLNEENLSALYDWSDNTRDILNFMVNYMPESLADLPIHLPKLPVHVSNSRKERGFDNTTLVCVGHSFGGNTTALAAIYQPILFSSVILADPIIVRPPYNKPWVSPDMFSGQYTSFVENTLVRKNRWSSKEEALNSFKRNAFFTVWDPAVLEIYVECALCEDGEGVRLKMSPECEAAGYSDHLTMYHVWNLLPTLDERVELKFIMPGKNVQQECEKQQLTWLRPKNASNVRIMHAGHLIPHEAPKEMACEIHEFVQRKYGTFKARI